MCVHLEAYFLFVILVCVLAVIIMIAVLHMHLRAESKPLLAMSPWVCHFIYPFYACSKTQS